MANITVNIMASTTASMEKITNNEKNMYTEHNFVGGG